MERFDVDIEIERKLVFDKDGDLEIEEVIIAGMVKAPKGKYIKYEDFKKHFENQIHII